MATPTTVATWALNGVRTEFDVTFDYLSRTYVKLTLIGPVPKPLVLGTDFEFITPTRVRTFVAYGPPTYNLLEVRRETSTTERLVEFQDASILTASDMNTADLQVLHVAEEARNAATETLGVNNDGHLDARGRRIVNGGDPVDPQDFATKAYIDNNVNGAVAARVAAEAARDAAKVHLDAAATSASKSAASANTANTHKNAAEASQDAAKASQDAAKLSETAASSHKDLAAASAGASKTSADASKAAELKAKDWAEKLPGAVEGAQYSAKYWAQQAASGVLPENSVVAQKMPLWNSANVLPDHNFWDVGTSWVPPNSAIGTNTVVADPTRGRGLRLDVPGISGSASGFAWEIRGRRFKVYPGRPMYLSALIESGITPGQPAASGDVAVLIAWTDEQSNAVGPDTIVVPYFQPGSIPHGDREAWVTPPAGAVYGHIRVRARHASTGTWSGFFIMYRPQVFMQLPIYTASIGWNSLDEDLQSNRFLRLDTGGIVNGQIGMAASIIMRHAGGPSVASQSISFQSPVASGGPIVSSWVVGINSGVEVRAVNNNNAGRVARFSDDGGGKRLYVFGSMASDGDLTSQKVTSREHVYGVNGRTAYLSEAVRTVNGKPPNASGDVTVASSPTFGDNAIGDCCVIGLSRNGPLAAGTEVRDGVGGVSINRMYTAGQDGTLAAGTPLAGVWKLLGYAGRTSLSGTPAPTDQQYWFAQKTGN